MDYFCKDKQPHQWKPMPEDITGRTMQCSLCEAICKGISWGIKPRNCIVCEQIYEGNDLGKICDPCALSLIANIVKPGEER